MNTWVEQYPQELRDLEEKLIVGRGGDPEESVGLAISGGGIRSATFGLGVLQALAGNGLLHRVDWLSTVSGGGYIGSFLGGLFVGARRPPESPPAEGLPTISPEERRREVAAQLTDSASPPLRWLRENGRYLSPNGGGDLLVALAAFIRSWVAVQVVLVSLAFAVVSAATLLSIRLQAWLPSLDPAGPPLGPQDSWSPLFIPALLVFLLGAVPVGTAYWWNPLFGGAVAAAFLAALASFATDSLVPRPVAALVAAVLGLTLLVMLVALILRRPATSTGRTLTEVLKLALLLAGSIAAVAFVDGLGLRLYAFVRRGGYEWYAAGGGAGLGGLFALAQQFAQRLAAGVAAQRLRLPRQLLVNLGAALVAIALLGGLSALTHGLAFGGKVPGLGLSGADDHWRLGGALLASLLLAFCVGRAREFLNLSSHQALYSARLARAYLGASNPERTSQAKAVTDPLRGDDILFGQYTPHARGGPVHLLNVTLNETRSGQTQLEQRDRKGMNMAVGPCGVSVGTRHHALWRGATPGVSLAGIAPQVGYQVFPREPFQVDALTVRQWTGISGAAFTTGLGARTSLGLSFLLGLANIRLGYWWSSGIAPEGRRSASSLPLGQRFGRLFASLFPVQSYLLDELLARFHGPARESWYLSDGGHFENTAAYELIRRRVRFIVLCDSGEDPDYTWDNLGSLVGKVRTDFGAEVRFLGEKELADLVPKALRGLFAPWNEIARYQGQRLEPGDGGQVAAGRAYATLARVTYADDAERESTLLLLKPNLRGDEPTDILTYWSGHRTFPQESTIDQYFDEAQWESYRCLGEVIGNRVFARKTTAGKWSPREFRPLPEATRSPRTQESGQGSLA